MTHLISVVVATPAHSAIAGPLSYSHDAPLVPGTLVRVPLGKRDVLGVVWDEPPAEAPGWTEPATVPGKRSPTIRPITSALTELAPLPASWRELVRFTASYYQRALGEVALAALPPQLRELSAVQLARRLKRRDATRKPDGLGASPIQPLPTLDAQQCEALALFAADPRPALLFGATGSGKTEVYLRAAAQALHDDPHAQVLVMVPEINLTPQLQARFEARFAHDDQEQVVALHSGLTPAQRLKSWLLAHSGQARVVLGTRMAVLASLPHLRLIVVDEEHDPSYKQQEGARYSARDLAVLRAKLETEHAIQPCRVLLGSATPSLESWQATLTGRYQRLTMSDLAGQQTPALAGTSSTATAGLGLATVRRVDMNHQPKYCVIAPPLLAAITERVQRGEQSLIFLNRRGYAPVLACHDCGWKSDCPHCSAYRVFHKIDRTLRCHHCGYTERVPHNCPTCGNVDISPIGRGTERLEEHVAELLAHVMRPNGGVVRISRIDADSTRLKGALQAQLAAVHTGDIDVLVGTQMIAKGHDFRHITLVAALNPDGALFSSDFRAPERLFSLLMQAGGRAGRDAKHSQSSEMWVQTFYPEHPLFEALKRHDYPGFAAEQLAERQAAGLSPFGFSALLRAEAKTQDVAQSFLNTVAQLAQTQQIAGHEHVTAYPAVPMAIQRVANVERAQMLLESRSRRALQSYLTHWHTLLQNTRREPAFKPLLRWAIDVDPMVI